MRFEIQTHKDIRGPLPYKKGLKIGLPSLSLGVENDTCKRGKMNSHELQLFSFISVKLLLVSLAFYEEN